MHVLTLLLAAATSGAPVDIELVGIVESRHATVVALKRQGRTRVAAVGETTFGHRVVSATQSSVTLEAEGRQVELRLAEAKPQAVPPPPPPAPTAPGRPLSGRDMPSASVRLFDRKEADRRLAAEIPRILAETTVVPERQDGRVVGLRLSRMPAGSVLLDAGLYAGDVITRLNGVDIDGMGTLISLWPRLYLASELEATVIRNGEPFTVQVGLR